MSHQIWIFPQFLFRDYFKADSWGCSLSKVQTEGSRCAIDRFGIVVVSLGRWEGKKLMVDFHLSPENFISFKNQKRSPEGHTTNGDICYTQSWCTLVSRCTFEILYM